MPSMPRSLTLFIPKSVSAFIRSRRPISHCGTSICQSEECGADRLVTTDYTESRRTMELQRTRSTPQGDDRPSRKPQRNKLFNILRRSRSPSRSNVPAEPSPAPALPFLDFMAQPDALVVPPSPAHVDDSKPPTRLPSRPLSSVTTTTNETVLPPTPKQTRRQRTNIDSRPSAPVPKHDESRSRPSTPKPSTTRQRLHNIFGIPLPNSRKSSLSRPASPDHQNAPPLPLSVTGPDFRFNPNDDPKSTFHDLPQSSSIQQDPSRVPDAIPAKEKTRASRASKLDFFRSPRIFSSSGLQKSNSTKRYTSSPSRLPASEPAPILEDPSAVQLSISAPTSASAMPSSRSLFNNYTAPHNDADVIDPHGPKNSLESTSTELPDVESASNTSPDTLLGPPMSIPKIIQTPPTPAKSVEAELTTPTRRRKSSDLKNKPGAPRPLAIVGEDSLLKEGEKDRGRRLEREWERWSQRLPSPKFFGKKDAKEKTNGKGDKTPPSDRLVIAITHNANQVPRRPRTAESSRKGPSRGDEVYRGSGLIGNGRVKHGSFDFEKPLWNSGIGAGSMAARSGYSRSGDSLQSGVSAGTHSLRHFERSVSSSHRQQPENESLYNRTPASSLNQLTPAPSTSSHATSYQSTAHSRSYSVTTPTPASPVAPSSPGRSANKRTVANLPAKVALGAFSFEPPIPPPLPSGTSTRFDTAARLDPPRESYSQKIGRRGGGSLDLGLGLAWAPSKVKEEALFPFGRTVSRDRTTRHTYEARSQPVSGADVTNTFREVLDEAGFAKFKKYVLRFDAHTIPFDGPSGIVSRVERLLKKSTLLDEEGRRLLLDRFIRVILQNA